MRHDLIQTVKSLIREFFFLSCVATLNVLVLHGVAEPYVRGSAPTLAPQAPQVVGPNQGTRELRELGLRQSATVLVIAAAQSPAAALQHSAE
jgi:hypothetical protein